MTRKYTLPKARADAKQARCMAQSRLEKKYQGQPCKHGHSGIRFTESGECIECSSRHDRNWLKALRLRITALEQENSTLKRQHAEDEAANQMLSDVCAKQQVEITQLKG